MKNHSHKLLMLGLLTSFSLVASLSSSVAMAQSSGNDLYSIFLDAQSKDPQYKGARFALEASGEKVPQAQALNNFQVSLTGRVGFSWTNPTSDINAPQNGNNDGLTYNSAIGVSKALYNPANKIILNQANNQIQQAQLQFSQAQQDLMVRTTQAYLDQVVSQYGLQSAQAQKAAANEQLEAAKINLQNGTGSILDVNEAQSRVDLITSQEQSALADLNVKRRALNLLSGRSVNSLQLFNLDSTVPAPVPNNEAAWVDRAKQAPQVEYFRIASEIAKAEIDKAKAAKKFRVDVVSNVGYSQDLNTHGPVAMVGVQFSKPLYSGGGLSSKEREAVDLSGKAAQDWAYSLQQAELAVYQNFVGVSSSIDQIESLQMALRSNQQSLESIKQAQRNGLRNVTDVMNALQLVYQTQRQLAATYATALTSAFRLKAAVGDLKIQDVQLLSAWLNQQ